MSTTDKITYNLVPLVIITLAIGLLVDGLGELGVVVGVRGVGAGAHRATLTY